MLKAAVFKASRTSKPFRNLPVLAATNPFQIKNTLNLKSIRYISDTPEKVFTKLSDENDPQRDAFFKYTWGSWLKNDKLEKELRTTKFSIEGLTAVLNDLFLQSKKLAKTIKKGEIPEPSYNPNLTVSLPHNMKTTQIGTINPNETVQITCMASIHEGKHHRIYKIDTNLGKSFVLRIPYKLADENTIAHRLKSEVATMDFADLKLNIKVPKIYCYGVNGLNPIRQPFILQEFIDGKLLMRDWSPLANDTVEGKPEGNLQKVVDQISDFQSKLISMNMNGFGSVFFAKDTEGSDCLNLYDNETNKSLNGRWKIGPSAERCLWRKKSSLSEEQHKKYIGPWDINNPMDIIRDTGLLEMQNAKARLEEIENKKSSEIVKPEILKEQITSFENLAKISPSLINPNTRSIPNIEELLKPRMNHPDLDPMNVLITEDNIAYLLDFEGTSIKPLILQSSPQFIAYDGPKVYNIQNDVPEFEKLSDAEKAQYEFMYKRTRNQFLWEQALNKRHSKFISSVAPPVKLLRSPYISTVEMKNDEEYLLIDESFIQLKEIWDIFMKNGLVKDITYPIEFTKEQIEKHTQDLTKFHEQLISKPFAATQGWIPQDMFDNLIKVGILVKSENGDYQIKPEQEPPVSN